MPNRSTQFDAWRADLEQRIEAAIAAIAAESANGVQWRDSFEERIQAALHGIDGERAQREQWAETLGARIEAVSATSTQHFAQYDQFIANRDQRDSTSAAIEQSIEDRLAAAIASTATLESTVLALTHRVAELEAAQAELLRATHDPNDLTAYWEQVEQNYQSISGSFADYRTFVARLAASERIDALPLCKFADPDLEASRGVLVGMRHDIDADPVTAVRMARCLAMHGLSGSFYFLHTAIYYGRFEVDDFSRNPLVEGWVSDVIVAGSEVGLHNDALGVWQDHGQDGGVALERELRYLRSLGAQVSGTAGHNSAPSYGAENCEVFTGNELFSRPATTPLADRIGSIDAQRLGLRYEGTFATPLETVDEHAASMFVESTSASTADEEWMRMYLTSNPILSWAVDAQLWSQGQDTWVLGGRDGMWHWRVSTDEALELVAAMPDGSRVLAVIHPELYRN